MNLRSTATSFQRTAHSKLPESGTAPQLACVTQILWIILLSSVCSPTLSAQRNERTIFQFQHASWTEKEGAPSPVFAFEQTTDGFLWTATASGLYRFDGIRFEPYHLPPDEIFKLGDVRTLRATPDGGLWIGMNSGGAGFLKDGHAKTYTKDQGLPTGAVFQFAVDQQGKLWAATLSGLAMFDGSRWHEVGADAGFTGRYARRLFVDRAGTLWVASEDALFFLPKGEQSFHTYSDHSGQIKSIGQTPDGALWVAISPDIAGPWKWSTRVVRPMPRRPGGDDSHIPLVFEIDGVDSALIDHAGGIWISCNESNIGLFRVRDPKTLETKDRSSFDGPAFERFSETDGLSGEGMSEAQLEDRDGNLWFATNHGVDRFREANVVPIVRLGGDMTLTRGDDGDAWSFYTDYPNQYLLRLHGLTATRQPLNAYPTAVYRDSSGVMWMGGHGVLLSYAKGKLTEYAFPREVGSQETQAIAEDRYGALWVSIVRSGVYRWEHGIWTKFGGRRDLPQITALSLFTDSGGRIWFNYINSKIAVLDGEHLKMFSAADGFHVVNVQAMAERAGHFWLGGERGLALFTNNHFHTILTDDDTALTGISGVAEARNGDVWLNTGSGIVHIPATEVDHAITDPTYRAHSEKFNILDGLRGTAVQIRPIPTLAESTDGRLWFFTFGGIFQIDPNHLLRNSTPPSVIIRSVESSGQGTHPGTRPAVFIAGTRNIQIEYTAPDLSVPERVRFRYKLEGSDDQWQDVGTRRQAFYTNLRPRRYRFQVIACNSDGVWNNVGDSVDFTIEPSWYQTQWFLSLCIALGLFGVWSLYRARIWQVKRAIAARFDERLSERTRMARELHDTFLQTIQGSKFVVDDGLEEPLDSERMHSALGQVSVWLDQAITEGRAALNSLRSSTTLKNELGPALRRAAESGVLPEGMTISVSIIGDARELHPIVRDELYRIGHEAIQNAKTHSHASSLGIDLSYADDLVLRVKDNGVGIDPSYAMNGREGHHGLQGMRERAARIRGRLTILSSTESGTDISVIVPGSVSFIHPDTGIRASLRKLYRRISGDHETL